MKCPKCTIKISSNNLNIQTDIAQYANCDYIFKISENLVNVPVYDRNFNINDTPKGTWLRKERNETIIGATTRSHIVFFLVTFMLIWSGGSIGGLYVTQIINGEFNLFFTLFGIPFLLGSIFFWSITFMAIWGKVEITYNYKGGKIFTGVGNLGIVKSFLWAEIKSIKEIKPSINYPGRQEKSIVLEGKKRIVFASGVTDDRSFYLLKALQNILAKKT